MDQSPARSTRPLPAGASPPSYEALRSLSRSQPPTTSPTAAPQLPIASTSVDAPVILTWPQTFNVDTPAPNEDPPGYAVARKPTTDVKYSFSSTGFNTMMLIPPADSQDSRPAYFITVNLNCFMPLSHITTIHRGANASGEKVGEFELGIIDAPARLEIKNTRHALDIVLKNKAWSRIEGRWYWRPPGLDEKHHFCWDFSAYSGPGPSCYLLTDKTKILARYQFPRITNQKLRQELEVTPLGQDFFDHLVLSLLIVERKRLTPPGDYLVN